MSQVSGGNLLSTRKLAEQRIDRRHVMIWNQRFQLGEQDVHWDTDCLSLTLWRTLSKQYLANDFSSLL